VRGFRTDRRAGDGHSVGAAQPRPIAGPAQVEEILALAA
jgi:hypothetical protein